MFRTTLYRVPAYTLRQFSTSIASRSVVGKTKQILNDANEKVGKVLANGMDNVEKAADSVPNPKEALDITNKTVGKVLADGLEGAEAAAKTVSQKVPDPKDALDKANKRAGETIAGGLDAAETAIGKAEEKTEEFTNSALGAEQRARVEKNYAGYSSLEDKGSKVELEQQRPDDAVGR